MLIAFTSDLGFAPSGSSGHRVDVDFDARVPVDVTRVQPILSAVSSAELIPWRRRRTGGFPHAGGRGRPAAVRAAFGRAATVPDRAPYLPCGYRTGRGGNGRRRGRN